MKQPTHPDDGTLWARIEAERKQDRLVRRISLGAWGVTLAVMLVFAAIIGADVASTIRQARIGIVSSSAVLDAVVPLLGVVGTTSLLLALVSTVGVFLRFRTASLADIQVRLTALEAILSEEAGADQEPAS